MPRPHFQAASPTQRMIQIHTLAHPSIALHNKRNTQRNIIIRARDASSLNLSIPKWFSPTQLQNWLRDNEATLIRILQQAPAALAGQPETLPPSILFTGEPYALCPAPVAQIERCDRQRLFRLPQQSNPAEQRDLLRQHLFQAAHAALLPKLAAHSQRLQLIPAAISLTRAKTFWGVCRARTGIKLNWRLICAPASVQDYVCIHELCHVRHPNHSRAFWQLVRQHHPQSPAAQAWLKQHGKTLFSLG